VNGSAVARLVRGWVDLYTRGLPADARAARRDEIDDDLWCEHDEAAATGRSARSLDADLALRLMFGIPSDISWRLSHRRAPAPASLARSSSMNTRTLGVVAIVAGLIFGILFVLFIPFSHSVWTGRIGVFGVLGTLVGAIAFMAVAIGLAMRFQDRIGVIGGLGAALTALGALASMVGYIVPLVAGTAMLTIDLARTRVVSWVIPIVQLASAIVTIGLALAQPNLDDLRIRALLVALLAPYLLTWIWMGVSLFRGVPAAGHAPGG
jgi:hypothetical protein